jgi:hypothetical protein
MKRVATTCAAAACPAVYEEDDRYVIVGRQEHTDAVPQSVADDESVTRVEKDLLDRIES